MGNIAQLIAQPETVVLFVFVILLVACIPLYHAIFSIGMVNKELDSAIEGLSQNGKVSQEEFYNQFRAINTHILRIYGLRHAWREFVDSMYFENTSLSNAPKKVYISHRPSYYFNRVSILGTRINLAQFFAYPNYLIGIGLTFTFIGLAAALHVAQAGLATGAGQQALKDLLSVASVKFISSIVGISSSLIISSLQRERIKVFQRKLDTFCDLLEEGTKYKSTEKLLHDSLHEQRLQTLVLKDMVGTIAAGVSAAVGNELTSAVSSAMQPLTEDIRALAQRFTESSEAALATMANEFLHALRSTSQQEMQQLMHNMSTLNASMEGLLSRIESTGKGVSADVLSSTRHLTETLNSVVSSFTPMQHNIAQLNESMRMLQAFGEKIESTGATFHATANENKETAVAFAKTLNNVSTACAPLKGQLTALIHALSNIHEVASSFKGSSGSIESASQRFQNAAHVMQEVEGRAGQKIKELESSSQQLIKTIGSLEAIASEIDKSSKTIDLSRPKRRWFR